MDEERSRTSNGAKDKGDWELWICRRPNVVGGKMEWFRWRTYATREVAAAAMKNMQHKYDSMSWRWELRSRTEGEGK